MLCFGVHGYCTLLYEISIYILSGENYGGISAVGRVIHFHATQLEIYYSKTVIYIAT
jgi:hypothetical protein